MLRQVAIIKMQASPSPRKMWRERICTNFVERERPLSQLKYGWSTIALLHPRWMEFLGSTAPIPANMLAERVGTKTESHGLET